MSSAEATSHPILSRDSTAESSQQAEGIFDLYGGDDRRFSKQNGGIAAARDSSESSVATSNAVAGPSRRSEAAAGWKPQLPPISKDVVTLGEYLDVKAATKSSSNPQNGDADGQHRDLPLNQPHPPANGDLTIPPQPTRRGSSTSSRRSLNVSPTSPENGTTEHFSLRTAKISNVSSRHPQEEEDAYHVRSTYARLEAVGVYGDGWDEGIERTRERAVIIKRPKSQMPLRGPLDIDVREKKVLATVDRYGFFDQALKIRSEFRLAKLPQDVFTKIPKLPARAPKRPSVQPSAITIHGPNHGGGIEEPPPLPPAETEQLSLKAMGKLKEKEFERVRKWEDMLQVSKRDEGGNIAEWRWASHLDRKTLVRRVYKGIPDRWRAAAWWTMTEDAKRSGKAPTHRSPSAFRAALDAASPYDVQIDLDVPRTISGHVLFHTRYGHGQRSLFHVLHAFSMVCEDCGYCQGMGPIAATLLSYYEPERAYDTMIRLHDVYEMHSIFKPGFPGLLEGFYVQEKLIEYLMPTVYTSFQKHMISASSYATKWYITLFANTVPFQTQLRIWDALFFEGRDVLVMVSVAIVWALRASLSSPNATFETILNCLSSYYVPEDEDDFFRWIRKMMQQPEMQNRMKAWRREWLDLVQQGKHSDVLL